MTKTISQLPATAGLADTHKIEVEKADGTSESCTAAQLKAYAAGGGTAAAPALRGTTLAQASANSITIALPAGAAVGDTAFLFAGAGGSHNALAGWAFIHDNLPATGWNCSARMRVLDAADITAGSVTVTFGTVYQGCVTLAVFAGRAKLVYDKIVSRVGASGAIYMQGRPYATRELLANDVLVAALTTRGNSANVLAEGMQQQNTQNTNGSMSLYTVPVAADGSAVVTPTLPTSGYEYVMMLLAVRALA